MTEAENSSMSLFCKSVAELDSQIGIAVMLKDTESIGSYVKEHIPVPNLSAKTIKILQASLVTSIAKENESYLGKVNYICINQELADVLLFPHSSGGVLCVIVQRPYEFELLIGKILASLRDVLIHSAD